MKDTFLVWIGESFATALMHALIHNDWSQFVKVINSRGNNSINVRPVQEGRHSVNFVPNAVL